MNKDLLDFYERWMNKANEYDARKLSDCFDKFITLFILYNALYFYIAQEKGHLKKNGLKDFEMATSKIKKYFPYKNFCNNKKVDLAITQLCKLVEEGRFFIRGNNQDLDKELISKSRSTDDEEKTKGILEFVYFIRCNLFHGQKSFTERQKSVLLPCITILEELNKLVFNSLRQNENLISN